MKKLFFFIFCSMILSQGCKKLIQVDPSPNDLTTDKVFSDTGSAVSATVSAYSIFNVFIDYTSTVCMGMYADELNYTSSNQDDLEFTQSRMPPASGTVANMWSYLYGVVYQCNDIISQLKTSSLPASYITDLTGEAKFLRAYSYYYLISYYGHIPLILTTNVNTNAHAANTDSASVYAQMVTDLKDAEAALSPAYRGDGRVRANQYAAAALLARVYLEQKDWVDAEAQATMVLNSGLYTPLQPPSSVFLANSQETILSIMTLNGYIAGAADLISTSGAPQYPISTVLLNAFEPGDLRRSSWIAPVVQNGVTYYFPYKYHNSGPNTASPEYLMILRAAEQYLIRADARAQQDNLSGAADDINVIRTRAGLPATTATSKADLLTAILHERQTEFFVEHGARFIDLKRAGVLDAVMSAEKATWTPTADLLPIPQTEISYDINLKQNPGY